ncbi:universal stress protein [Escherichia coli]|uniref:universal stress protein n=1 Tax=Escherichia coli TaxID=562 RepID=UPI003B9AFB71
MATATATARKIVVAVDGEDESMHALSWCLKNVLADDPNDKLVLIHAKPSRVVYPSVDPTGYALSADLISTVDLYGMDTTATVIERAKRACKGLRNVKVEARVANGDPKEVICETVEKVGADTLVMGTHGYGPLQRILLGSVSSYCAQHAKCPVLIVKKPTKA